MLDGWRFCPRCAQTLAVEDGAVRCDRCGFAHWSHSVPGVEAVCADEHGRVLLGRRACEPGEGLWDLPGGFLEEGEPPLQGLRREVLEETGLELEPTGFVGFYLEPYGHRIVLCLTWAAKVVAGTERPGDDLVELRWFAPDELPSAEELAFSHYVDALSAWRHEHA
jgi:ADP-ribose pyrophosphatase YjhB (NUDIX family)